MADVERLRPGNVLALLRERQLSGNKGAYICTRATAPEAALKLWAESDLLRHCGSTYCQSRPEFRSTIATAFSPDGALLASTHGDHTVKITCCRTGVCLQTLGGHARTPWVVRFHPHNSRIVASGSLDYHVRIWSLDSGKCLYSHNFGRPIASVAFNADGEELAVAAGHKLYIWKYIQKGKDGAGLAPTIVLKTRRSLRAVHFHPRGAPILLSAEVNAGQSSRSGRAPAPVESTGISSAQRRSRGHRVRSESRSEARAQPQQPELRQRLEGAIRQLTELVDGTSQQAAETAAAVDAFRAEVGMQVERNQVQGMESQLPPQHNDSVALQNSLERPRRSVTWLDQEAGPLDYRTVIHDRSLSLSTPGPAVDRAVAASEHPRRAPSMEIPLRPVLSLSMPGPRDDEPFPLHRHSYPTRPSARPMDIGEPSASGSFGDVDLSWRRSGSSLPSREQEEIRRFHAMLRAGGINPAVLTSPFPPQIPLQFYAEADSAPPIPPIERLRTADISTSRGRRCTTSGDSTLGCRSLGTEDAPAPLRASGPGRTASSAPALSALPQWEAWREARGAARPALWHSRTHSGALSEEGDLRTISEEPQRRRTPWDFLRRVTAPAVSETRTPLGSLFRGQDRAAEEPPQSEPPQMVLERISNSGGPVEEASGEDTHMPDLAEVIESHWSGGSFDRMAGRQQPSQQAPATALPPSLVSMGWEFPAANILPPAAADASQAPRAQAEAMDLRDNTATDAAAEVRSAASNVIGAEQPSHVLVRLWHYDTSKETPMLDCLRLAIHNATLCSEMGVHFSPCGRLLAACTAVEAPAVAMDMEEEGAQPSYELRIYSLEPATFGRVLQSRPIRAAQCLTSVQFSPTSQHILLAYGRRHISLLRSLVADDRSSIIPVHTILEVYRVSDMSLVRVLPSADDEVNAASFHPFEGGGIAYGTKEGRLRILTHASYPVTPAASQGRASPWSRLEDELLEADQVAAQESSDDE